MVAATAGYVHNHGARYDRKAQTHYNITVCYWYHSFSFGIYVYFSLSILVGKHSAQWALDDVLIGMNDSSRTGFHDKFDGMTPLRHNWYRIQGGEVTVDCLSLDTALNFNSEAIDSELLKNTTALLQMEL